MIIVSRVKPEMLPLIHPLTNTGVATEEALIRVSRAGLELSYVPLPAPEVRLCPPLRAIDAEQLLGDPNCLLIGAFDDALHVGGAAFAVSPSGWLEVLDIRVEPTYRCQGLGAMLLAHGETFARKRDLPGLHIAIPDTNAGLCRCVGSSGFSLCGFDRMALFARPEEQEKPAFRRAALLHFYKRFSGKADEI